MNSMCVESGIFPINNQLKTLSTISSTLTPSAEHGASAETFFSVGDKMQRVAVCAIPTGCSRHNAPGRPHAVTDLVKANKGSGELTVVLLNEDPASTSLSTACAVARAFPTYALKQNGPRESVVRVYLNFAGSYSCGTFNNLASSIQLCQKLVDMPPNILHTDHFTEVAQSVAASLTEVGHAVNLTVIRGDELRERGMNGLFGVGQAAVHPSALVVLSYTPPTCDPAVPSVCMVGKGIVYDTGGLSIKTKEGMPGMKRDMGGSAGVLGAFQSLVLDGGSLKRPLHALLCLAENSVGPEATRPDDIHVMYSGKTVEINNTDAEGRLVLSDGVAFASKHLNPSHIVDMATLTGAQGIATGKRHAAVYTNDESLETLAVRMGRFSGDLVHPIPYCPEFFTVEFASAVADMKNSVACRTNAQTSCAGQFIGNHLDSFLAKGGSWMHIDMAYPSHIGERATGYGVALLYTMVTNL